MNVDNDYYYYRLLAENVVLKSRVKNCVIRAKRVRRSQMLFSNIMRI